MAKRKYLVFKSLASIPGCDVSWFPEIGYVLMKYYHVNWLTTNCEVANEPVEIEVPSVDVQDTDVGSLLFEKCGLDSKCRLRRSPPCWALGIV